MTTNEKLGAIAEECRRQIKMHEDLDGYFTVRSVAGWRATLAAIEGLAKDRMLETQGKRAAIDGIIAAWEGLGLWT